VRIVIFLQPIVNLVNSLLVLHLQIEKRGSVKKKIEVVLVRHIMTFNCR